MCALVQARHYGWQECTDNTLTIGVFLHLLCDNLVQTTHDIDQEAERIKRIEAELQSLRFSLDCLARDSKIFKEVRSNVQYPNPNKKQGQLTGPTPQPSKIHLSIEKSEIVPLSRWVR